MITALLRQRFRRDWLQLLLWILGTALMAFAGYSGVTQSYATFEDRQNILAAAIANPVILMFRGLPSGASQGAFLVFEVLPWLAILAALMSLFLAVRHTRADEEAGRSELLAATPAGRTLPTIATIVHGVLANVVLTVLTALALISTGLDAAGSIVAAAAAGATGVAFLGIGLIAAQLMRTSRGANSLTVWVLVATFLLRGIGNAAGTPSDDLTHITSAWPAWLSPFGWAEQTRPFDANAWGPVVLAVGFGIALAIVATVLQSMRDIGASFIAPRLGRAHARPALSSTHALVWRLSAGSLIGWAVGGALTGILATTLGSVVDQIAGENQAVVDILKKIAQAGSLDEVVVTVFFTMLGIVAGCCAVQTVVRARQEETHGTAEPILGTPVRRVAWLADYLIVATCSVLIVVAAAVVFAFVGAAAAGGDADMYRTVLIDGAGQAVAASVFTVITGLVFVLLPRATMGIAWAVLLVATMLGMFGPLFGMPEWTTNLSPFSVTPVVSGSDVDLRGLWWLVLAIAVGAAASLTLMRRRELATSG
ncbi:polyketide antibiotic transporter [Microbacterium protaetiae]|uniref:Polyketide antibiotic transporter n=1 Tax=Microbacterium protaetiae TaxID=2509458 RepID=A0A4P6EB06_9MICO|nr:polyketide antibiotic transporter [Microbacterium protaetiae]QAY59174.1 polyketide antibiotic transporter [Microbacterium protaetiae]